MNVTFRPLPVWPHRSTPDSARRSRWTFKASYEDTLDLLATELWHLGNTTGEIVLGVGLRSEDLRRDGMPRAAARPPSHPGVELSFPSRHGTLTYATDAHEIWQHNLRAIALSLQALRAVDRYGVSKRGEQYAGWAALTAGASLVDTGRDLVARYGSVAKALRATHPDTREAEHTDRDFQSVMAYREAQGTVATNHSASGGR